MRLEKVLKEMQKRQLTHLIISDPSSIDYLINYKNNPGERMYLLLLSIDGHHKLFMNNLFYLDHELDIEQVWYSDTDNYLQLLADEFDGACSIGIDKNFPARFLIPLMNLVDECHFELGSECVDRVRMIKDEKEQQLMIEASKINDLVVDEVINICAKGDLTEEEVSKQLEGIYQKHGCTANSFEPIVAYGKMVLITFIVEMTVLFKNAGDSIVIDIGGLYKGYCSDMTRTVFYKEVSPKQKAVYELVLKAQKAAEAIIKPGVRLCDIDKCARDIIAEGGYTVEFNHRLGHFIGRDVHEWCDVSQNFDLEVQEGMTFSIEPGVYLQGEFGVRIEDLVLVTKDGCKVLNSYPKDLRVIGND